jgi:predicted nucleotide-binding protein
MDQKVMLRTTLLALEETVRALASEISKPSPALVQHINSVFAEINKLVPGSQLARFDSYPNPVEVLPQIKLALGIVGQDAPPAAEDEASQGQPTQGRKPSVPDRTLRPEIFIGCSVEGLTEAKIIQMELAHSANTVIWSQGVFGLSRGTLETLVEKAPSFTHAILVLTPDDMLTKRANESRAARDNVLFELGLFMGALGRERTFVVTEKSVQLPTDLAGVATVSFQRDEGVNLVANLGPVVTKLQLEMGLLYPRDP